MATLRVVVSDSETNPVAGASVRVQPYSRSTVLADGGLSIVKESKETTNAEGVVTFTLRASSELLPANTPYAVYFPGTNKPVLVEIPTGAGTHNIEDVLVDPPGSVETAALSAHRLTVGDHVDVDLTGNATGKVLMWDGTKFAPADTVATDLEAAGLVTAHSAAATGVHGVGASTVESVAGSQAKVDAHVNDATDAHPASAITVTPSGLIVATSVQAALQELDTEKAGVAVANTFTARQSISTAAGTEPALKVTQIDVGTAQEWWSGGKRIARVTSQGFRIFAQDEHGQGDNPTDFLDIKNVPDEFMLSNASTATLPNGQLINADITFYSRWRIRPSLKDPHIAGGLFELREDYVNNTPAPLAEHIPFRLQHSRPEFGAGVHDHMRLRPIFGRLGAAGDGYRAIRLNVVSDAPAGATGIKHLLSLAIADVDKFVVTNTGAVTAAGAGEFAGLTILGAAVATQAFATTAIETHRTTGVHTQPQPPIIGSGATQAVAGNDPRLTDSRTPNAHTDALHADGPNIKVGQAIGLTNLRTGGTHWWGVQSAGPNIATPGQSVLTLGPAFLPVTTTFDRIAVEVTTLVAGSTVRLVVYSDNGFLPSVLLVDQVIDSATIGTKEVTINQQLTRGIYWIGTVSQGGAPALRCQTPGNMQWPVSVGATFNANQQVNCIRATSITGAPPNPWTSTDVTTSSLARVGLRAA